jgi:hypothetical protein
MEDLEKMQPRARERDIFRALRRNWVSTPKIRPTAGSLRLDGRQGAKPLRGDPLATRSFRAQQQVLVAAYGSCAVGLDSPVVLNLRTMVAELWLLTGRLYPQLLDRYSGPIGNA